MCNNRENINILVVEDDSDINNLLCKILTKEGYNVRQAYSGSEGKMCLEHYDFHLVLLDLMLPGVTGEELIEKIRAFKTMPIIVISAKAMQNTKIEVLRLGADDFIAKPFDPQEVLARIEAQLRRYMVFSKNINKNKILKYKNLVFDKELLQATVKGITLNLTAIELSILEVFISYPSKVFTKANLFKAVWKTEFLGDDNTVNVHVSNLRSKVAKLDKENEYIHTVWGIGYKLSGD
ncbi:response regulator transcription factor [Clostridium gasigenes]|uniref:Stage 0 sporulation protein A homolog n=1 Tax=Clostridium gasigenes TaxID=94869 RepID=A0A7X0RAR0_9CLOT|nr:response regulator transcription factor [Clostridium gasigenes]MBB6624790.1 response regulator transcription factor [Clostridium gasigenes]MBB6714839.1 response regulator transcription factor [Clostridium gasigenes]MBU3105104.1 response regulator transcription factor [Clostridium gasigenes]MBU3131935.1 response regulator transcription factor [Clostridium gasigenes]NKF08587.1 response regulator transcription factor [Clostridium gasigenes]